MSIALAEAVQTWFPSKFQFLNNLIQGTFVYGGVTIGSFLGGVLYQYFNFHGPFLFCGGLGIVTLIMSLCTIPQGNECLIPNDNECEPTVVTNLSQTEKRDPLTIFVIFPLVAQMMCNFGNGYIHYGITPFLKQCCDVPIAQGGSYAMMVPIGIAAGFFIGGILCQRQVLSANTLSLIGVLLGIVGLVTSFPSPTMHILYANTKYVGYFSTTLSGLGESLVTSATIDSMEMIQTTVCGLNFTESHKSKCVAIWLIAWYIGIFSGVFVSGVLFEHTSFHWGAWILACMWCASFLILLLLRGLEKLNRAQKQYRQIIQAEINE